MVQIRYTSDNPVSIDNQLVTRGTVIEVAQSDVDAWQHAPAGSVPWELVNPPTQPAQPAQPDQAPAS